MVWNGTEWAGNKCKGKARHGIGRPMKAKDVQGEDKAITKIGQGMARKLRSEKIAKASGTSNGEKIFLMWKLASR